MDTYEILIRSSLSALSLLGLYSSWCFAKPHYDCWRQRPVSHVEAVCNDRSCVVLENTRWGKLLGFPNWWLGFAFYAATLLAVAWTHPWLVAAAFLGAILAVTFSFILMYGLAVHLKAFCKFCYLAHFANFGILITWLLAVWQQPAL